MIHEYSENPEGLRTVHWGLMKNQSSSTEADMIAHRISLRPTYQAIPP